ncbi:DUF2961 domain-containing protein [Fulvivirgaceae bacterium BMA12]|uniref:DUF2961 domain-containing protein n=1 Tax=Agaribacillus aureus TaxID=3051825 RepID=A0ABT8L4E3_9BACT|nr:DUF2961 domain-containing protein [Fulvivirgaceae bacterium BMA12]
MRNTIKNYLLKVLISCAVQVMFIHLVAAQELYIAPSKKTTTRWVSFENPTGEKGQGGKRNKGAKGAAMNILEAGETRTIFDVKGPGVINRIWMTGAFVHSPDDRRNMLIEIYWDGEDKPAVTAPVHDFFGMGLAMKRSFESEFFSQPEGRSYNSFIQMPFRKAAKIVIHNKTAKNHMLFFDVNYSLMDDLPERSLYFHAYWHRDVKTKLGEDFEILPKVNGNGRYLGANIGVICDTLYLTSWFGEGEVKIFLDGDDNYPTLCGTGTEDYVGTGWGQNAFYNRYQGSPIGDQENGLYAFYRYHIVDPVFFEKDCRVTLQQMGNAGYDLFMQILEGGAELEPVSVWHNDKLHRVYEGDITPDPRSPEFPKGGVNFWRRDDVSATAYFYLDRPSNNLPAIQGEHIRIYNNIRLK